MTETTIDLPGTPHTATITIERAPAEEAAQAPDLALVTCRLALSADDNTDLPRELRCAMRAYRASSAFRAATFAESERAASRWAAENLKPLVDALLARQARIAQHAALARVPPAAAIDMLASSTAGRALLPFIATEDGQARYESALREAQRLSDRASVELVNRLWLDGETP